MEVFSAITPSSISWGPPSASSTAACGQALLELLCPSALLFYLDLSYHDPSCPSLGCPHPSPDALFWDGRFPPTQRVLAPLPHGPSHVPWDSAHALCTALAGWSPSSCWKSWERPEIFHSLAPLPSPPFSFRPFFPRRSQFWAVVSYAVALL